MPKEVGQLSLSAGSVAQPVPLTLQSEGGESRWQPQVQDWTCPPPPPETLLSPQVNAVNGDYRG